MGDVSRVATPQADAVVINLGTNDHLGPPAHPAPGPPMPPTPGGCYLDNATGPIEYIGGNIGTGPNHGVQLADRWVISRAANPPPASTHDTHQLPLRTTPARTPPFQPASAPLQSRRPSPSPGRYMSLYFG